MTYNLSVCFIILFKICILYGFCIFICNPVYFIIHKSSIHGKLIGEDLFIPLNIYKDLGIYGLT